MWADKLSEQTAANVYAANEQTLKGGNNSKFEQFLTNLPVIGGIIGSVSSLFSDPAQEQYEYQKSLMELQNEYNKEAMETQVEHQKEMYEYTGYASKIRQLKDAGLNPALLYGSGSTGGGTVGNSSALGVGLGSAPNTIGAQSNKISIMGMGLQLAKLKSEIEVNQSIAEANKAEAASKQTDIPMKTTLTEGYKLDNSLKQIELSVNESTLDGRIKALDSAQKGAVIDLEKKLNELTLQGLDITKAKETLKADIDRVKYETQEALNRIVLQEKQFELTNEQIKQVHESIKQAWTKLEIEAMSNTIDYERVKAAIYNTNIMSNVVLDAATINAISGVTTNLINSLSRFSVPGVTPIKGFGK